MSATTMHFGPEWMRTKQPTTSRPPAQASPPPPASAPAASAFSYSALVSPAPESVTPKRDEVHPFRYSKEDMLRIYKHAPAKPALGLEVERWEGVIREIEIEPVAMKDMTEAERKLFAGPLNSELRRRQSADLLSPLNTQSPTTERPRLSHTNSGTSSPLRERFGGLMGRRRDSADQALAVPRKLSLSSNQAPQLGSPRDTGLQSPRTRIGGYTPSFDGVLNSSESWVARRRASEGLLKTSSSNPALRADPGDGDPKPSDIREEEDETIHARERSITSQSKLTDTTASENNVLDSSFSNISLSGQSLPVITDEPGGIPAIAGPPPGILDLASVEWSYLDPQGQIQGPFRADLMQKWYDDGYFAQDLLMKRTQVDTEWLQVGELARRAGGEKIFLSPPAQPVPPPGLGRRTESPSFADQSSFNTPYQPAPIRSLRTSTLESYLANGSNPSDSPSSSFGAARFGNGSPDPTAFAAHSTFSNAFNGPAELGGFPISRRNTNEPLDNARSSAYSNLAPGRTPSVDNFNSAYSPAQGPWQGATSNFDNRSFADLVGPYTSNSSPANASAGLQSTGFAAFNEAATGNFNASSFSNGNGIAYSNPQTNPQYTHYPQQPASPLLSNMYGTTASKPSLLNTNMVPQSPWKTSDIATGSPVRRPGPFEGSHPTTNNTVGNRPITPSSQASPWPQAAVAAVVPSAPTLTDPSPWFTASQATIPDNWNDAPGPSSLTFDNVGQHNQQQVPVVDTSKAEKAVVTPVDPVNIVPTLSAGKTRKAVVAKPIAAPVTAPKSTPIVKSPSPPPVVLTTSKAPWSSEEELKKVKPSGVSLSLRDIQDAEAKKADARKVADRERERAVRAVSTSEEAAASFTASWGLPTSQAGNRVVPAPVKESSSPTVAPASAPVWTTGAKPPTAKKTMKEIQEEEERRKKAVAKETTAAAARRAYAETTNKVAPVTPGSAWTTVGPSGKGPVGAVTRPPAVTANSSLASTSAVRTNGTTAPARPASVAAPVKAPPPPKVEEPVTPSHDFLKWLSDSLKGLNTSVNVEEIMSMLLSFPIDPDSSTAEIISDLIYANSTTLDGRRFASEFVSKRKTDATLRPKGSGAAGSATGKPISIADVVKAQPKPTQPEWGGFKVVNKKKKGGRS